MLPVHTVFAGFVRPLHIMYSAPRSMEDVMGRVAADARGIAATFYVTDASLTTTELLLSYDLTKLLEVVFMYRELQRVAGQSSAVLDRFSTVLAACAPYGRTLSTKTVTDALLDHFSDETKPPDAHSMRTYMHAFKSSYTSEDVDCKFRAVFVRTLQAVFSRLASSLNKLATSCLRDELRAQAARLEKMDV